MGRGIENVQLRLYPGTAKRAMHQDRIGQEEIARAALQQRRRETLRVIAKQRGDVRIGEVVAAGIQQACGEQA
ncbi:hypothetical protein D3C83_231470 [compost metagenome]